MKKITLISLTIICSISSSFASSVGGSYAWDTILNKITTDLSSNVAIAIGITAIVICGGVMAFIDLQAGGKKLMQVLLGLSIAFGATTILSSLYSAGAVI